MDKGFVFEYAVIRIVPRVEKEEFINAGVIVFCKRPEFLGVKTYLNRTKVLAIDAEADLDEIEKHLKAFEDIAHGSDIKSPVAKLDAPSRFRWLAAKRSTMVQTSPTHTGICSNPQDLLEKLFQQYLF